MTQQDYLPPINRIHFSAPFVWLVLGWRDLKAASGACMAYGAGLAVISMIVSGTLYLTGKFTWFLVLAGGFMIVAPVLAMGLFRAAQILETGGRPSLGDMLSRLVRIRSDLILLGVALFVLFGMWAEAAYLVYGLSTSTVHRSAQDFLVFMLTTPDGLRMAAIGTVIGGIIAFLAYAIVVVSAPMLLDEETDVFAALISSVRAVLANFPAMLVWALLIVLLTGLGIATAFVGLAVIFPWIALSSWHAYRSLVASPGVPPEDGHRSPAR